MKLKVLPVYASNEAGKFAAVAAAVPEAFAGSLIDVGCRGGGLSRYVADKARYLGVDLTGPCDLVANLEFGLPVADKAFVSAAALDVLEHTNNMHAALDELFRVAKRYVVLTLPNCYELAWRVKYIRGRSLGGKYALTPTFHLDRHRWLFTIEEARHFLRERSAINGFRVVYEGVLAGERRRRLLTEFAIGRFPQLLAQTYFAALERRSSDGGEC